VFSQAGHGQGVNARSISVAVAVVPVLGPVASSPHVNGTQSSSTLSDTLFESFPGGESWPLQGVAVVCGPPTRRVNLNPVQSVDERLSLDLVGDVSAQHLDHAHLGVVGHAHSALLVVGGHGDLASAPRPVVLVAVVRLNSGVATQIPRQKVATVFNLKVLNQVFVVALNTVVENSDVDAFAGESPSPDGSHVQEDPSVDRSVQSFRIQVPLLGPLLVVEWFVVIGHQ